MLENIMEEILCRIKSMWLCAVYGYVPMPIFNFKVMLISEDHVILTNKKDENSLSAANWALERPEHYWKATALGQSVIQQAEKIKVGPDKDD